MLIAQVYVENISYPIDKAYDYIAPGGLRPGSRVVVPFGVYNALRQAIVVDVRKTDLQSENLKKIKQVIDDEPILNEEMLKLLFVIKDRCFCTLFQALKLLIPTGLSYSFETIYKLNQNKTLQNKETSVKKEEIIQFVKENGGKISKKRLLNKFGNSSEKIIYELCKSEIIKKELIARQKTKEKFISVYSVSEQKPPAKLTSKQQAVVDYLKEHKKSSAKEISYYTAVGISVIKTLEKKNIIRAENVQVYREPGFYKTEHINRDIILSPEQQGVFKNLKAEVDQNKPAVSLLYGVTGSGKTSVFMKMIEYVTKKGKSVILMVPEIALTSKLICVFKTLYKDSVAVFHSGLSAGERLDEFRKVKNGNINIVIGTRSAVFAPLKNLGLIIMDEEQESSYKSAKTPSFDAHEIAKWRCKENNSLLLLCSATPSLESYYMAQNNRYSLNVLKKRYGESVLPDVRIIDMNQELANGNNKAFSQELLDRLTEVIKKGQQAILLLNRRGYNTFASCKMCSNVITCPNCSISMTYHSANNKLMCHYCGFSYDFDTKCPYCDENFVRFSGQGTQKIEQDLKEFLPDAKILRMDADTTLGKNSHDKKLSEFEKGEFDIMVGTQMVAKGLDFENVTLVGIVSADNLLYSSEFRSYEKAFDLLTQVVGRAGRGKKKGVALIQTNTPENDVIKMASQQDYDRFYESEIAIRKAMLYPPFCDLCVVTFSSKDKDCAMYASKEFFDSLKRVSKEKYSEQPLRVLGPSAALIIKVSNRYRYKLIIKCKNNRRLRMMISELLIDFANKKQHKDVKITINMNPDSIF
ncbi:MAG: primosomal protein N' [Clostridia bacterium]|nr:primosomal protein N' [Clostridia bacterium]